MKTGMSDDTPGRKRHGENEHIIRRLLVVGMAWLHEGCARLQIEEVGAA